jgi:hypothetical protein
MSEKRVKKGPNWSPGCQLLAGWRGDTEQSEMARLLEVDKSTYCKFESGHRRPGLQWAMFLESVTSGLVPAKSWWDGTKPPRRARRKARAS